MKQFKEIICEYFKRIRPDIMSTPVSLEHLPLRQFIDSVGMLEFLCFLEKSFSIKIDDDDVVPENFKNIASIVKFVEKNVVRGDNNALIE